MFSGRINKLARKKPPEDSQTDHERKNEFLGEMWGENHRHSKWPQQRVLHNHQGGGKGVTKPLMRRKVKANRRLLHP